MSDSLAGTVKRAAREAIHQSRQTFQKVADATREAISHEAEREGLTLDKLGHKVRRAASHVRNAVAEVVSDTTNAS
jgi:hypothetical protein